jgi:hypothetical protein
LSDMLNKKVTDEFLKLAIEKKGQKNCSDRFLQ